jgi:hypothetical protein
MHEPRGLMLIIALDRLGNVHHERVLFIRRVNFADDEVLGNLDDSGSKYPKIEPQRRPIPQPAPAKIFKFRE